MRIGVMSLLSALLYMSLIVMPTRAELAISAGTVTGFKSFLPLVSRSADGGGGNSEPTAGAFLPYQLGGGIMTTRAPQIAVDGIGVLHMVYTANAADATGRRPAYYAECAANCNGTASMTTISLGEQVASAQLALDPSSGKPRVLLMVYVDPQNPLLFQYLYGQCEYSCTNPVNWVLTPLLTDPNRSYRSVYEDQSNRWFALDPQGHPAFIYHDKEGAGSPGTMVYANCSSACTNANNWNSVFLSEGEWLNPALAFEPGGQPRIAFLLGDLDQHGYPLHVLYYLECNLHCAAITGVVRLASDLTSPQPESFSLRIDSQGHPRMAYYPGSGDGELAPNRLYYLACDINCAQPSASWAARDIGLPAQIGGYPASSGAHGVDLALDGHGQPRIVYHIESSALYELGYTWCNTACATDNATWSYQVLPSTTASDQELGHIRYECPTCYPPVPPCLSFWDGGVWPSLALDADGDPRIVFEVQLNTGGGSCSAEIAARLSRFAALKQVR